VGVWFSDRDWNPRQSRGRRPSLAEPARRQNIGNGLASRLLVELALAAEFEERPPRGAKT